MYYTVEQISRPFTQSPMLGAAANGRLPSAALTHLLPSVLLRFGFVALWRYSRSGVCAGAESLPMAQQGNAAVQGRESKLYVECSADAGLASTDRDTAIALDSGAGNLRDRAPILVWPEGISQRLDDCAIASRDRA